MTLIHRHRKPPVPVDLVRRPGATTGNTVGHEPDLGQFAVWLIGAKQPLQFKKGGVARIDLESLSRPREGQLIWMATPRLLRTRK